MAVKKAALFPVILITLTILTGFVPFSASSEEGPAPDPVFGLVESHDVADAAADLGVGWSRAKFHWGVIQPTSAGDWEEPDLSDAELAAEIAAGREVVGLIVGLPVWASNETGLPSGLHLDYDDPANAWGVFIRALMTRYQGRITHWIIWNEPDIWDTSHPASTWRGTEFDFVALLRTAYLVADEVDPAIQVHLPAMTHWWDVTYGRELYFSRLLDALVADPEAAAHGYYYDIATMHVYFNSASTYELLTQYREIQQAHGIDKPFWLVETNAAPADDPLRPVTDITFSLSLTEQAAFIPQALSGALAAGAERVAIYKAIDTPGDWVANPEPFGLLREDGSRRPAYLTARQAIARLGDAMSVLMRDDGPVTQVVVTGSDGSLTRILWSRTSSSYRLALPVISSDTTIFDMWGNKQPVSREGDAITMFLPAGECQETIGDFCMIGGPVFYVIDDIPYDGISPDDLWLEYEPDSGLPVSLAPSAILSWVSWLLGALLVVGLGGIGGTVLAPKWMR